MVAKGGEMVGLDALEDFDLRLSLMGEGTGRGVQSRWVSTL